jgi:hypothetical protein
MPASRKIHQSVVLAIVALAGGMTGASAQTAEQPQLHLHQTYMEEVMRPTTLDVSDPMKVFAYVLNSLPDRVKVYPTENYFYFKFNHNGVEYAGNIRLDASDRDQGKVQFAYYEQSPGWLDDTPGEFRVLDQSSGVKLEKLERFLYRLSYKGKSVIFELNDLSRVRPPANALAPKEIFVGPVFDDSGVRFFLIYSSAINNFLYILDETVTVTDDFISGPRGDRILVGKRTGFVFYLDRRRDRKILIGVYDENVQVNNYFDGPFDQLPDNFIEGETLRNAILKIQPNLKGRIDRFGGTPDGELRYTISPYLAYKRIQEFDRVDRCASRTHNADVAYYRCFIFERGPQDLRSHRSESWRPSNARKLGGWGQPNLPQ